MITSMSHSLSNALIIPMFAHVALTSLLYALLTIMRAPSVWNIGARDDGTNPLNVFESRISANLSNQFEWPLFFYIACIILMANQQFYSLTYLYLAWVFILGRVVHGLVQVLTSNIRLRGIVFTINFLAVFAMWVLLLLDYIKSSP